MKKPVAANTSEAPGPAAGYIYQLRYALFRGLKRLRRDPTASVGIERLDDVIVESAGSLAALEQLKHTTKQDEPFTDHSPAVWRTIANWSSVVQKNSLNLAALELILVTNASVAPGSGLSKLGIDDEERDPSAALTALKSAAVNSQNQKSKGDREAFLGLDGVIQAALVRCIRVAPNSPNLAALADEIEDIVHYACEKGQLPEFRSELEGWWLSRISSILSDGKGALVPLIELDARVSYLREKYKTSALQIDVPDSIDRPDGLDDYLFVKQIRRVNAGDLRIHNAQRDFLKASAQRSKWLRESRIDPAELNRYDATLEEHWSTQFAIIQDELSSESSEDEKCKCGRQLLGWAETHQNPLHGASAQFLTSGTYHTLADQLRLGWHPDFKKLFDNK